MIAKALLLVVSLICVLLVVVLAFILITGQVPFHEPVPVEQVGTPAPPPQALTPESRSQFINDLISALQTRQLELDAKRFQFNAREQKLLLQEKAMKEMTAKFTSLQNELMAQQVRLENDITSAGQQSRVNLQRIAEMCSKMDPASAVDVLSEMDADRVAVILSMLDGRPAAKIMDAATEKGPRGAVTAARWAEAIERMKEPPEEEGGPL